MGMLTKKEWAMLKSDPQKKFKHVKDTLFLYSIIITSIFTFIFLILLNKYVILTNILFTKVMVIYLLINIINFFLVKYEKLYFSFISRKNIEYIKKSNREIQELFYIKYNEIMIEKEKRLEDLERPVLWYKNNNFSSSFMNLMQNLAKKDINLIEKLETEYCLGG